MHSCTQWSNLKLQQLIMYTVHAGTTVHATVVHYLVVHTTDLLYCTVVLHNVFMQSTVALHHTGNLPVHHTTVVRYTS